MKDKIIKLIKKNPFLYNLAKKINSKVRRKKVNQSETCFVDTNTYYAYIMKKRDDLELIKKHYNKIKKPNTQLLIIVDDINSFEYMHKLIRENINIYFTDLQYFKKYNKKISIDKYLILDYNSNEYYENILEYLI